jgi:hypothetical protein
MFIYFKHKKFILRSYNKTINDVWFWDDTMINKLKKHDIHLDTVSVITRTSQQPHQKVNIVVPKIE